MTARLVAHGGLRLLIIGVVLNLRLHLDAALVLLGGRIQLVAVRTGLLCRICVGVIDIRLSVGVGVVAMVLSVVSDSERMIKRDDRQSDQRGQPLLAR